MSVSSQPDFEFIAESRIPSKRGEMYVRAYRNNKDQTEPTAIFFHSPRNQAAVPLRVHDACFTSEVLGSLKCDCKEQLEYALDYIAAHGGVVIYLQQEGRGIGLANKIAAYALQEKGLDTVEANLALALPADQRQYEIAAFIVSDLALLSISLMTNNPRKVEKLQALGVSIDARLPIEMKPHRHNQTYLRVKQRKMRHLLNIDSLENNGGDT